jgi:hypothetical protein
VGIGGSGAVPGGPGTSGGSKGLVGGTGSSNVADADEGSSPNDEKKRWEIQFTTVGFETGDNASEYIVDTGEDFEGWR